jgi:hypothetical protein
VVSHNATTRRSIHAPNAADSYANFIPALFALRFFVTNVLIQYPIPAVILGAKSKLKIDALKTIARNSYARHIPRQRQQTAR